MALKLLSLVATPGLPGAKGRDYPVSVEAAAGEWAEAVGAWTEAVVPFCAPPAHQAAVSALRSALISAFASPSAAGPMDQAFIAFAAALGAGMAPSFVAAAPTAGPGFDGLFSLRPADTREEGVARVAQLLSAWIATGTATPLAGGPPIPWS